MRWSSVARRAALVAGLAAFGVPASAQALHVSQSDQVVFYYDVSSGNGDSLDFSGYGTARLRADAPGQPDTHTFGANYYHNRTFPIPDESLKYSGQLCYCAAEYVSGTFSTSSSSKYHTRAGWSYSGDKPGQPSGYSRKG